MQELFQHIERLLTGHDCVVVPGLGGFVLHEVQFSVGEDGSIFRPGGKEISFNVRLTFNDGILVQSYQESHNLTFEDAVETIREKVADIRAALNEGHIVPVGRLGTLRKNEEDQLLFRPDNRNLFCPECYGLSSFVFHTLEQRALNVPETGRKRIRKNKKKKDEFIHIRLSRHTFSQVLTGVAAGLLFLLISKPAGELRQFKTQEAFLLREYFMSGPTSTQPDATSIYVAGTDTTVSEATVESLRCETTRVVRTVKKKQKSRRLLPSTDDIDSLFGLFSFATSAGDDDDSSTQQTRKTRKNDTTTRRQTVRSIEDTSVQNSSKTRLQKPVVPKKNKVPQNSLPKQRNPLAQVGGKTYCIIVSSHPNKALANEWLSGNSSLSDQAEIIEGDGRARVSVRRFDNPQEAEKYLRQFRKEHPQHADAWLLPTSI